MLPTVDQRQHLDLHAAAGGMRHACGMHPVATHHPLHGTHLPAVGDLQKQEIVGNDADVGRDGAGSQHRLAPKQRGADADEARLGEQALEQLALGQGGEFMLVVEIHLTTVGPEPHCSPVDHADRRVGGAPGHQGGEAVRQPEVVLVDEGDPVTLRHLDGGLPRRTEPQGPTTRGLEVAQAVRGVALGNGRGVVGGGVVPEDDLDVSQGLGNHAVQGLGQGARTVVRVDDHADERHGIEAEN